VAGAICGSAQIVTDIGVGSDDWLGIWELRFIRRAMLLRFGNQVTTLKPCWPLPLPTTSESTKWAFMQARSGRTTLRVNIDASTAERHISFRTQIAKSALTKTRVSPIISF